MKRFFRTHSFDILQFFVTNELIMSNNGGSNIFSKTTNGFILNTQQNIITLSKVWQPTYFKHTSTPNFWGWGSPIKNQKVL